LLLHVHVQGGVLFIWAKIVRILYVSLGVSSCWHIAAIILRCRPVRTALPARLSEVTIVNIDHLDASAVGVLTGHINLIFLLTSNVISLAVCGIHTRVRVLLIILILLQKHHSFLPSRYDDLPVVRSFRTRVGLAISSHLHVFPFGQPVR
jgi:hypothetical protein